MLRSRVVRTVMRRPAIAAATCMGLLLPSIPIVSPAMAQIFGPTPVATPARYLVERLGIATSEADARHGIGFRPFTLARHVVAVALLPPFHGPDVRANRGIGFEYAADAGRLYVIAQWPSGGGDIDRFSVMAAADPACPAARNFTRGASPSGIVWSTPHGLVMTLQADGKNDEQTLRTEWKRLIRRGVCR